MRYIKTPSRVLAFPEKLKDHNPHPSQWNGLHGGLFAQRNVNLLFDVQETPQVCLSESSQYNIEPTRAVSFSSKLMLTVLSTKRSKAYTNRG